jgi:very-short-patch-repair endonuclease
MRGPNRRTLRSRNLRVNQTDAETALWNRIRNRQIAEQKFVRQQPIGRYICDFVCREKYVVIEVDGGQHSESARDAVRDRYLQSQGYRVMRFWNNDVLSNIDGVVSVIDDALRELPQRARETLSWSGAVPGPSPGSQ